ncbi:hypothetical protein [Brevundimonas sp.]|uniref:hypothetical protein n=1 Tax=Brevundimonas sp. TaxID=1871086 RepID=UPI00286CDFFD|nr:hypothetical protein [Brevundimonas sp.]
MTVAALAVLAAVTVTVAHESVGHGSVCLALGGRVTLLTTSLFRCDVPSFLIDLGGPLTNLGLALVAALASRVTGPGRPAVTLYLVLIAAMGAFWDGGYLVQAMLTRDGDLYFAWAGLIGEPSGLVRGVGALVGAAIYLAGVGFASRGLSRLAEPAEARRTARIAWLAATVATVGAALLYRGGPGAGLLDAFMEIGAASLPLLLMPLTLPLLTTPRAPVTARSIRRNPAIIGMAVVLFAAFALTMGRGLGGL